MNECINRYFCRPWWDLIFYIIESPALKRWAIAIKTLLELSKSLFALSGIQPKMRDYACGSKLMPPRGTGLTARFEP